MTDSKRIFITVGTHEDPFDRLVRAGVSLAHAGHEVRMQVGTSQVEAAGCTAAVTLSPTEMQEAYAWADIVISHGGPSTLIEAAGHGHVPVLVPRRAHHGEHVDDHQLWFARRVADRVHVVEEPEALVLEIERHDEMTASLLLFGPDAERTRAFATELEQVCENLVAGVRPRRRVRGRLLAIMRWMRRPR